MKRHPYVDLWIVLSISLLVLLTLALSDIQPKIGSYSLKKAPFRESLFKENRFGEANSIVSTEDTTNFENAENLPVIVVDETPHTFLFIGDSMVPNLARRLSAYAGENGHIAVHAVNWDSSTTISWAESSHIDDFIAKYRPTFIFVCLGSNECYLRYPEQRISKVRKIIEKFDTIPYVWIGPPHFDKQGTYNDMLARVVGRKNYFSSDELELQRGEDNIHPIQSASNIWMDAVMRWIPQSAHPFLSNVPNDSTKRSKLTFDSFGPTGKTRQENDSTATILPDFQASGDSVAEIDSQETTITTPKEQPDSAWNRQ